MKKAKKMTYKGGSAVTKMISLTQIFLCTFFLTQSFLLRFSWRFDNITVSNENSKSKKDPASVSEITISYLHKNIIIPLLCQFGLFVNTCVSKNSIVSKDLIFYLLWCNAIRWSSHICKKSSFFSFSNFLVKFRE